jgi:hypothetical protein
MFFLHNKWSIVYCFLFLAVFGTEVAGRKERGLVAAIGHCWTVSLSFAEFITE